MRHTAATAFALCALCTLLVAPSRGASPLSLLQAARAREMILGLDLEDARRTLEGQPSEAPEIARERGRLALYEADCDAAASALAPLALAKDEEGTMLLDIARGCARVTAAIVEDRDDASGVVLRYQDEADRALTPLIVETIIKARTSLSRDLGVTWPAPMRVIVVRDLLSLSAMTGLPYESAQTTGTVAVAKWGRVTLLSPRASQHGYAWRDTLAHELTHLAVTRLTVDRAPLWLQEGLAKREEVRWRATGPFDDRPSADAVARRGIDKKLDLPLGHLGPSIAMLPSAEAASAAFAEVTSFVRFYATAAGEDALKQLLAELRGGKSVDEALKVASGSDLAGWDSKWRAEIMKRASEPVPGLDPPSVDPKALSALRDRVRLTELLFGREHFAEAQTELAQAARSPIVGHDPSFAYLTARVTERAATGELARATVADPARVAGSYGPWWAVRGRLAQSAGDAAVSEPSFIEAVGEDPFSIEASCRSLTPAAPVLSPPASALCAAARAASEPDLGRN